MARAAAVWLLAIVLQEGDPQREYESRAAAAPGYAATKLTSVGAFLSDKGMHAWAREAYLRAIYADPDHEGARKRLGERRTEEGGWEADPSARVKSANEKKKDEEAAKIRADAVKKAAEAERLIAAEWAAVAALAEKASLKAPAEAAWREAIAYKPDHEAARKKLGFEKGADGVWRLAADRQLRAQMRETGKAAGGAEEAGKSEVGEKMGLTFARRGSEHFLVESSYLDQAALTDLVQRAETCWSSFHQAFGQSALLKPRYNFVILSDQAQHEKFIDLYHGGSETEKAFSKKQTGWGGFPRRECRTGDRPATSNQDFVIHYSAQAYMGALAGPRALWVLEGSALWFTSGIQETAVWACVDMAGTGAGATTRNLRDPKNWRPTIREWLAAGTDPGIDAIVKCTKWSEFDGSEAVKAWSVIDFLMTEHRERFIAFLQDLKTQKDTGEASLRKAFGWTLGELEARWRVWAASSQGG